MSLFVGQREVEQVVILDVSGRLTAGQEAIHLRGLFDEMTSRGKVRVIINAKGLDFIDSTGLGVLVMGYSSLRNAGGAMKLLNLSRRSAQLLVLTKLSTVFEIFDDEQSAVNSFFPEREIKRFDVLKFVRSRDNE
jgi:anti-sigma B factor antagonist